ncbi:MAG: ABC transporter permease [Desulfobacterales bacterium]|jgi:lipopolysaccharide transport system permease protein|nr:ABC transporter permease [Desulfobacterales bacterium]
MLSLSFIFELTRRDFSERFAGSTLGALWALIWPLVNLFIYIVIFGRIMGSRLPGVSGIYAYGIYLTSGLIAWVAFSQIVTRCSTIFFEKKNLISKVRLSLPSLLAFVVTAETVTYLISMVIFFLFLILTGYPLSRHLVLLPFVYLLQLIFAFGIGLLAATLAVFLRDLKEIVGITLQLWFWFTPIVYVADILPAGVQKLLRFNPAYVFIDAYHHMFVYNEAPALRTLMVMAVIAHLMVWGSYVVFKKLEKDVRDFL